MLTAVEEQPVSHSLVSFTEHARHHELTELVMREKKYFLRVANSILHNTEDAEDAVHGAFCSAWKSLGSFRGEASMKTWFTRIVSNHAIVALKKLRRNRLVFFEDNPQYLQDFESSSSSKIEDPETVFRRHEELALVHSHIEQLPQETRIVVRLYLSGESSPDAIARVRGKSRASIAAHLQRGKAMLRRNIHGTRVPKESVM
jgi:RNA polymerase sigma-70 factor (ECF subfamily)